MSLPESWKKVNTLVFAVDMEIITKSEEVSVTINLIPYGER